MKCPNCQTEYDGDRCPNCGMLASNNNSQNAPYIQNNNVNENVSNKVKKPIHKKWWFWLLVVIAFFIIIGMFSPSEDGSNEVNVDTTVQSEVSEQAQQESAIKIETEIQTEKKETIKAPQTTVKPDVPIEYRNAVRKAESYAKTMHMSKKAIYQQLTSEYGEQFSEDAADYAMNNMKFDDWNGNALAKARSYQNQMSMSKNAIYDQLVSEYGEKFTPEQAQYAIDNL